MFVLSWYGVRICALTALSMILKCEAKNVENFCLIRLTQLLPVPAEQLQVGGGQRKGWEKESRPPCAEQKCVSLGWFLHGFVGDLLFPFRRRFFFPNDLWRDGPHVWIRHPQRQNMEESKGEWCLGQDIAALLSRLFLSLNVNHAPRRISSL